MLSLDAHNLCVSSSFSSHVRNGAYAFGRTCASSPVILGPEDSGRPAGLATVEAQRLRTITTRLRRNQSCSSQRKRRRRLKSHKKRLGTRTWNVQKIPSTATRLRQSMLTIKLCIVERLKVRTQSTMEMRRLWGCLRDD